MAFTTSNGRTQTSLAEINITPLVDVVLVLLIIFMLTAPVIQSGIEVAVPQTRTVKQATQERLVLSIDKQQRVFLNDTAVNINEIAATLQSKLANATEAQKVIYLRADQDVPFGAFATVMDSVKQAGITNVSIVTQPIKNQAGGGTSTR
jgi:biopolymer transport protein TolR